MMRGFRNEYLSIFMTRRTHYMQKIRKRQISRRLLLICSYIDLILGYFNILIYLWYRICIYPRNYFMENVYWFLGMMTIIIGGGGLCYEEILRKRYSKDERMLQQRSENHL